MLALIDTAMKQSNCFVHVASIVGNDNILSIYPSWVESDRFVCNPPSCVYQFGFACHIVTSCVMAVENRQVHNTMLNRVRTVWQAML